MAMRCHYKVLSLELNATTDDIKRAYRKLALRWHPGKSVIVLIKYLFESSICLNICGYWRFYDFLH